MSEGWVERDGRPAAPRTDGTGGWVYLAVLAVVAVAVVAAAFAIDGDGGPVEVAARVEPAEVVLRVEREAVILEGRIPEPGVRVLVVELAGARYGAGNVADALVVDERTTLDGGVVRLVGSAAEGDPHPLGLQADITSALGLRAGPIDLALTPVEVDVVAPPPSAVATAAGSG